ncbi:hypothetical protein ACRQ5Q_16690 [Bradyrhizobium sp. PMVTL-01]|uniref:hypothetical protein n=1 Tax=Bradyrhizobium sp. PMVTL-01 TaxID=3434999 RepID=UPI003F705E19
MTGQFQFAFDGPAAISPTLPGRRIDITIERLRVSFEALSDAERSTLVCKPWWAAIDTVLALRAMERSEEEATGRPALSSVADIYDQVVSPGEHAGEALLRVSRSMFQQQGK